jgi:hypothetical protein
MSGTVQAEKDNMRERISKVVLMGLLLAATSCGKKGGWLVGQWLLLDEEGKPGVCHEFRKDGTLVAYTSSECGGNKDQVSSGRWEMKDDTRLAIIRYNERKAQLVMLADRTPEKAPDHVVCRGAVAGTLFRVGPKGPAELLAELERKGLIKVKPLDPALGCRQIALPLKDIRALPEEKEPRMLRHKDQALKFFVNTNSVDPRVEKAVYALNDESLEWMALHLTAAAFNPPGPQASLESSIGKPLDQVATGTGEKRQHIVMWKSYCALTRDAPKRDIDVTLFSTAGAKRGTIYVSDNVVAGLWEELKQMASDPANQATEEDEGEGGGEEAGGAEPKATPAKAGAKVKAPPPPPRPEPKPAGKAKPAPKGEEDDDDI